MTRKQLTPNAKTSGLPAGILIIKDRYTGWVIFSFTIEDDEVTQYVEQVREYGYTNFVATYRGKPVCQQTTSFWQKLTRPNQNMQVSNWINRNAPNIDSMPGYIGRAAVVMLVVSSVAFLIWALVSGSGVNL